MFRVVTLCTTAWKWSGIKCDAIKRYCLYTNASVGASLHNLFPLSTSFLAHASPLQANDLLHLGGTLASLPSHGGNLVAFLRHVAKEMDVAVVSAVAKASGALDAVRSLILVHLVDPVDPVDPHRGSTLIPSDGNCMQTLSPFSASMYVIIDRMEKMRRLAVEAAAALPAIPVSVEDEDNLLLEAALEVQIVAEVAPGPLLTMPVATSAGELQGDGATKRDLAGGQGTDSLRDNEDASGGQGTNAVRENAVIDGGSTLAQGPAFGGAEVAPIKAEANEQEPSFQAPEADQQKSAAAGRQEGILQDQASAGGQQQALEDQPQQQQQQQQVAVVGLRAAPEVEGPSTTSAKTASVADRGTQLWTFPDVCPGKKRHLSISLAAPSASLTLLDPGRVVTNAGCTAGGGGIEGEGEGGPHIPQFGGTGSCNRNLKPPSYNVLTDWQYQALAKLARSSPSAVASLCSEKQKNKMSSMLRGMLSKKGGAAETMGGKPGAGQRCKGQQGACPFSVAEVASMALQVSKLLLISQAS